MTIGLVIAITFNLHAQRIGDVFGKAKKMIDKVTPDPWKPGSSITTSIKDTLFGFDWIDQEFVDGDEPDSIREWSLAPGHYKATVRSYCLHAGAYAPTKGDGYQIAKLKGTRSRLVHDILERSAAHTDIQQHDVQTLIWGIESGSKFSNYGSDFQLRVKPLLTAKDIASMEFDVKDAVDKMAPEEVKEMSQTYTTLRGKMQSGQMKYDEIEAVAVKTGVPPLGIGSKVIHTGVWSYIGDGFYLKARPQSYPTTDIELYRPANLTITKDSKDRVNSWAYNGYKVEITYDDAPGSDVIQANGRSIPVWKIRSYTLTGPDAGQRLVVPAEEWYFREPMDKIAVIMKDDHTTAAVQRKDGPAAVEDAFPYSGITWEQVQARYAQTRDWVKKINEYEGYAKEVQDIDKQTTLDEYVDQARIDKNIYDGLKAATNPINKKGQSTWIRKNLKMTMDLAFDAICKLAGKCDDNTAHVPDLPSNPAQPGNTSAQRIGLSNYVK